MIRKFAVFVVPIISLVLDKTQKATKKEKFTNTVFVSHAYQTVCHICSLIMVGIAIALGLFMGFDNTVGHSVVFAIFVLLIEFCAWALKRHKVVIDGNNLRIRVSFVYSTEKNKVYYVLNNDFSNVFEFQF